jgi:hypothetical protein
MKHKTVSLNPFMLLDVQIQPCISPLKKKIPVETYVQYTKTTQGYNKISCGTMAWPQLQHVQSCKDELNTTHLQSSCGVNTTAKHQSW